MLKTFNSKNAIDIIENNIYKLSLLDIIMLHLLIERGMSRIEISEKTGIPYNSVRQFIITAIQKIKNEVISE